MDTGDGGGGGGLGCGRARCVHWKVLLRFPKGEEWISGKWNYSKETMVEKSKSSNWMLKGKRATANNF